MAIKNELFSRIQLKYDSYTAWTTAPGKDLVLKAGEMGICAIPSGSTAVNGDNTRPQILFKVGDGTSTFEALPWASAKAADVYDWAKAKTVVYNSSNQHIEFIGSDDKTVIHSVDISEFVTATELNTILTNYKTTQTAVTNKRTAANHVLDSLTQNANGEISYEVRELTPADIGAQPAGNYQLAGDYKTKQIAKTFTGSTSKTVIGATQNTNGEIEITYGDISFPEVTIPDVTVVDDSAPSVPETATVNVYQNLTANGHALTEELVEVATAKGVADALAEAKQYADDNDTNTAHTHKNGTGTTSSGGGVDGEVAVDLNVELSLDNKTIYLKDKTSKTKIASLDASDFIKDGMLDDVDYDAVTNTLTFTWNTDAGTKTDTVELSDILDPYTFAAGNLLDVSTNGLEVTYSHETVADPTGTKNTSRDYINGVITDGYGHITGFTYNTETDQDLSNYKTKQTAVSNKRTAANHVLDSLTQNANGEISYTVRVLEASDIGAQPEGNYKTIQTAVADKITDNAHVITSLTQNENGEISYDVQTMKPEHIGAATSSQGVLAVSAVQDVVAGTGIVVQEDIVWSNVSYTSQGVVGIQINQELPSEYTSNSQDWGITVKIGTKTYDGVSASGTGSQTTISKPNDLAVSSTGTATVIFHRRKPQVSVNTNIIATIDYADKVIETTAENYFVINCGSSTTVI